MRAVLIAALVAVIAFLAGCGGGPLGGGEEPDVVLTVTLWPNGLLDDSITWKLECDPPGGDHPDPAGACAALGRYKNPFAKLPRRPRCNEIPGASPEIARIEGTFHGRKVDERFDRSSGCVFERWDRLRAVFATGS